MSREPPRSQNNTAANTAPALDVRATLRLLRKAEELIGDEQFHDALLLLAAVLNAPEDQFFKPNHTGGLERSVKVEALRLLGGLPPEGLQAYENQFGDTARRLLSAAIEAGGAKGLREVARRFFYTRAGAVATYLLGSYELDHGQALAAVQQFERVARHPLSAQFEPRLSAQTAACWQQLGREEKATEIAAALQRRWPAGTLSVGDQIFRVSDPQWLSAVAVENARRKTEGPDQWLMPGGDVAHNAFSFGGEPLLTPRWDAQSPALRHLAVEEKLGSALVALRQRLRERDTAALPSLRPLAAAGLIVSRTFNGLQAVDHKTGELAWRTPFVDPGMRWEPLLRDDISRYALLRRLWFDSTYGVLSCDGQHVFAVEDLESQGFGNIRLRIDSRGKRRLNSAETRRSYNRLAAYDLRTGKIAWEVGGVAGEEGSLAQAGVFFLGPPTPLAGSLYAICEAKDDIQLRVLDQATGKLEFSQFLSSLEAAPNGAHHRRRFAAPRPRRHAGLWPRRVAVPQFYRRAGGV